MQKTSVGGVFKIDLALFKTVEKFDWNQLFNLSPAVRGKTPPSAPAASYAAPDVWTKITNITAQDLPVEYV